MDVATALKKFEEKSWEFFNDNRTNIWIEPRPLHIYLRKSKRLHTIGNVTEAVWMLDLANFHIEPNFRGKGLFTKMLDIIDRTAQTPYIFVENIIATSEETAARLIRFLERRGFQDYNGYARNYMPCMVKPVPYRLDLKYHLDYDSLLRSAV